MIARKHTGIVVEDRTTGDSVSDELRELLKGIRGVGDGTVEKFGEEELYTVEDVADLTPVEMENRVENVGFTKGQRIFETIDAEGQSEYSSIQAEVDFTAVDQEFPDHVRGLINKANETAQSTRPEKVGQMSELFDSEKFDSIDDWKEWYLTNEHTDGLNESLQGKTGRELIDEAADSTWAMIQTYQQVLNTIDREMVKEWVEELVLVKTAEGLVHEKKAIEYLADEHDMEIEDSSPDEESRGIDGYLDGEAVSVKSAEYGSDGWREAAEDIDHAIIQYWFEETDDDADDGEEENKKKLYLYFDKEQLGLSE